MSETQVEIGAGMAVCVDHRGHHPWVLLGPLGPDDGFCQGLIAERMQARAATPPAPAVQDGGEG